MQTLKRDVTNFYGTFTKGTQVLVTGEGVRGYSFKDPVSGAVACECGFDCFENM